MALYFLLAIFAQWELES